MIRTKLAPLLFVAITAATFAAREESFLVTSVHSRTIDGYQRPRTDTGEFKPEYYAISNGGAVAGSWQDNAVDKVPFSSLAKPLGELLARQNYHLAKDKDSADLLLVVHWGATMTADRAPSQQLREMLTAENARMLGYTEIIERHKELRAVGSGASSYLELDQEIVKPRYYLVVSAYDFRSTALEGKRRLLWITRVSIRSAGNSFAREFSGMLAKAAPYFGQNTERLLRQDEITTRVEIGELQVIGSTPATPAPQRATPDPK